MANTSLLKPTSVEVALSENNPNRAVITLEPFERGYGHTLGNALRRILLSSMIGFAPTEVQITGIVHEYSQIDGVLEDVVDILLNLKGVVFKLDGRDEVTVMLRKDGEGVVTAAPSAMTTPRLPSAASSWMPPSPRSSALPIRFRPPAWPSAPTSTSSR